MDPFVKLFRNANHVGRHLTQGEIEAAAGHIESLVSAYYRRVAAEEQALVRGFELGWKDRDAAGSGIAFDSVVYTDRRNKVLEEEVEAKAVASDGVDARTVKVTGRNADGSIDTEVVRVLAHGGSTPRVRDPRKEPHEYVTVENHQGCGVCGFGIGAAVHNNLEAARWVRPGEKVLQFEQVLSLSLRALLDRTALTEFVLVHPLGVAPGEQDAVRLWYDPIAETVLRELPVDSSAGLWFVAKLPKAKP